MAVYKNRDSGTWYFQCRVNGQRTSRRGFKTKSEALKAEATLKESIICSRKVDEITEEYIQHLRIHETSSAYTIESTYRNHIGSVVGRKRIDKIKLQDIKGLQMIMLKKTYGKGRHYTNKTINLVTGTFNMIMNYAVKYGYIRSNPCANFESLKTVKTNDEIKFWTDMEFQKAIRYEDDFMWYCFLVLAYMTGMRKGEIRGLRWSDIDFDNHIISINRHISDKVMKEDRNTENDKRVIRGRKNGHAHKIAMDFHIENLLKELRKDNSFIDGWSKESYVFGIFKPIGQNSPKRHLDIIAKKAGIKQITVHGLRHSHVSYLISKGLNAYEIAERIGDTVEMVFKVYGHMFPNPQRNIVNVLNSNFAFIQERDKIKKGRQNERQHFPGSIKNPDIYGAKCYNGALNRT